MPAPRKFSREQVGAAALALVDEQGLSALTMRNVATALGTGAMTIYNYVDGREGLEALLVDAVLSGVRQVPGVPSADWRADVRAVAEAHWRAVRAHPDVIPLILTRRSVDPSSLAGAEQLLGTLARGGRSGAQLLVAFRAVTGFVMGFAQAELAGPLSIAPDEDAGAIIERVRALPQERFPRLIEIAEAAAGSSPEAEFHAGLDFIVAGLGDS
ncbi:TetR/AcrR family transcriptional regulator C-terminal domain-containing protein [Streptomyces litchfieldiae]|uniref:TetR/AcrR family transcriptional regulator C-terminal domain-containing protein n=1 Tax=Streptomyces litchfieldiae TaxID=3075543 RepID=A0ABU2MWT6_9ACTN|nr:TetR/AcrR family transcriptional regulator C-terminal domain-containing protein [Streptomyces sp. DSM 44938]MDT0346065.1 TetR/AcrR family transcriptional regulator C-terminal domain-containing protein [Streptomyces sp. DSM 44938]